MLLVLLGQNFNHTSSTIVATRFGACFHVPWAWQNAALEAFELKFVFFAWMSALICLPYRLCILANRSGVKWREACLCREKRFGRNLEASFGLDLHFDHFHPVITAA